MPIWEMASIMLLSATIPLLVSRCIAGITANREACIKAAEGSLALSTAIAAIFDYPKAGAVARYAAENGLVIRDAAIQMGVLSKLEAEEVFDVSIFADPPKYQAVMLKYRGLAESGRLGKLIG